MFNRGQLLRRYCRNLSTLFSSNHLYIAMPALMTVCIRVMASASALWVFPGTVLKASLYRFSSLYGLRRLVGVPLGLPGWISLKAVKLSPQRTSGIETPTDASFLARSKKSKSDPLWAIRQAGWSCRWRNWTICCPTLASNLPVSSKKRSS